MSAIEQVKGAVFEVIRLGVYAEKQSDLLKDSNPIMVQSSKSDEYLIKAENLNFSYGVKSIYNNVNLTVGKGEKIAIVGKLGSGKSTLLLLLAGMLRYSGSLKYGVENFEDCLSVVLQNMTLKKGSVLDNLEWKSDDLVPLSIAEQNSLKTIETREKFIRWSNSEITYCKIFAKRRVHCFLG